MAEGRASLRRRLLAMLVGGIGAAWLAVGVATFLDARLHAERMFDAQLTEYAEVLAALAGHEAYEVPGETTSIETEHARSFTYQVFAATGELLLRSHAAPTKALSTVDGFSVAEAVGERWRVFRHADIANRLVIVVAHRQAEREAVVGDMALNLLVPMLVGLPLVALVIWLAVRRALAPLAAFAGDVGRRDPGHLAPVEDAHAPQEVKPLARALNDLFARLEASFENERRFTGDAAHELRTPLAALRTQAEVALTTVSDDRRRRALEHVVTGVDRATRLVDQMLQLARLDATVGAGAAALDLSALVRETVPPIAPRVIELEAAGGIFVTGDGPMLQVLVRNLVDNAVRHARHRVRVTVVREGAEAILAVEDDGPGVPHELHERIFDRFFRAPDAGEGGSGLGLSIARRVAELHRGTLVAGVSDLGGLRMRVALPLRNP